MSAYHFAMFPFMYLVVLLLSSFFSHGEDYLFIPGRDFHYDGAICRFERFFHSYHKVCPWGWNVTRDRNTKLAQSVLEYYHPSDSWSQYPSFHPLCCRPLRPFEQYGTMTCKWVGTATFCRGECEKGWMDMTVADSIANPTAEWHKGFKKACWNGVKTYCCRVDACNRNSPKYLKASSYLLHVDNFFKTCSEQCTNTPRNESNPFAQDTKDYQRCVNTVCASVIPSGNWKHQHVVMTDGYLDVQLMLLHRRQCVESKGCPPLLTWGDKQMHKCMESALGMEDTLVDRGVDRFWHRANSSCHWSLFCPPVQKCDCGEVDSSPTTTIETYPYQRDTDKVGDGLVAFFKQCSERCEAMEGVISKKECVNHLCSFVIPDRTENEPERYTTEIYTTSDNRIDIYRLLDEPRRCKDENPENDRERQICLGVMVDFERLMASRGIARDWKMEGQDCNGKKHCPPLKRCDCIGMPYPSI